MRYRSSSEAVVAARTHEQNLHKSLRDQEELGIAFTRGGNRGFPHHGRITTPAAAAAPAATTAAAAATTAAADATASAVNAAIAAAASSQLTGADAVGKEIEGGKMVGERPSSIFFFRQRLDKRKYLEFLGHMTKGRAGASILDFRGWMRAGFPEDDGSPFVCYAP